MDDIEELCKRVIVIDKGNILFDGELKKLIEKYIDFRLLKIILKKEIKKDRAEKFGRVTKFTKNEVGIKVPRGRGPTIASEILKEMPVDDLLIESMPIEDVVRKIFTEKKILNNL
jgi:ABC-2 type transport system ATP-binding protein